MKRKSDSSIKALSPKDGSKNSKGIRTRLSTGTLIMSGTSTISLADAQEPSSSTHSSFVESDMPVSKQKETMPPSAHKRQISENKDTGEFSTEPPKRRKIGHNDGTGEDNRNDYFCWICHKDGLVICCELCPRVFHAKCLTIENNVPRDWICPECEKIMQAECTDTRSKTMSLISVNTLCTLLRYALDRMRTVGSDTFEHPVDPALFPSYSDYIFYPMSLSILEKNIKKKSYGCTEAFLADAKWIYHNSVVYNGAQNKITSVARAVLKVCKHEMSEIEVCPDCYYNSCVQSDSDWFCEPCRNPHPLVWAKLKGYPFWPAKALRESNDQVDVRFFGAHDRSWVPVSSCFMLSKVCPVVVKKGRGGMAEAMREVEVHIKKLKEKLGTFEYAPFQTPYKSDAVYSKLKNIGESSKHASHGKMGKSKASEGRLGEKQSVVSKTAMALKSKYISMSSKKGGQQVGNVSKPGATQSQQVIYLKPMPKGVFLLSEQTIENVGVKTTTHGTILRRNIPVSIEEFRDLQLIKRISDKIQPAVVPSSSQEADSKTQIITGSKEGELSQLKDVDKTNEMETDAVDTESTEKGEVNLGKTVERSKNIPVPMTDAAYVQSSVTTMPLSVTNLPLPATVMPSSVTDVPLSLTNVPLSSTHVSLASTVSSSITDTPLSAINMPSPVSKRAQNSLLPENIETNVNVSVKQLDKSESAIAPFLRDKDLDVEISEKSKGVQDLEKEKQDEAGHKINSSVAEVVRPPTVDAEAMLSVDAGAVEVSSKSSSVQDNCAVEVSSKNSTVQDAEADKCGEDTNSASAEVSLSVSKNSNSKDTEQGLNTDSSEISTVKLHESKGSAAVTDKIVEVAVCKIKTDGTNKQARFSHSEYTVRLVSPTKEDNLKKSPPPVGDTSRHEDTGVCVLEAVKKKEQCELLRSSDGKDLVKSTQNASAASPSPCSSSISVSSSNSSSSATSIVISSPGSTYKESLQKVIDSCKAKLGIDDENLNAEENDVVVLEGDEEESIVISDNELDEDSDVLLMDIDEHSQEPPGPVARDVANNVAEGQSHGDSASLKDALTVNPATGNEQLDANLHSEIPTEDTITPTCKSISSAVIANIETTNTGELGKNTGSDKVDVLPDKSTDYANIVARSLKEKDRRFHAVNKVPDARNFVVSVISKNQSKSSASDISPETSTKTTDSNSDLSRTIPVQSAPAANNVNAVSNEQILEVKTSGDEAVLKSEAARSSAKAPEIVDEASFLSYDDDDDDDDQYDDYVDDSVTLDMEVECSDGPEENSDEEIVSDEEVIKVATTSSIDKNIGGQTNVSSGNAIQSTMQPPGKIIVLGNKDSSNLTNYTALRGALAAPPSPLNIFQNSSKSSSVSSSTASTSGDSVRLTGSSHLTSAVSQVSEDTEVSTSLKLPRILSSEHTRKAAAACTPGYVSGDSHAGVVSNDFGNDSDIGEATSRSFSDQHEDNSAASTSVGLNGSEGHAESHVDPARSEGSAGQHEDLNTALTTKIESLVKNKCSLIEKIVMEQFSEIAADVRRATEMSIPKQNDTTQGTAIEKLEAEHTKKQEDLKRALNAALKESLANFTLQKAVLADKLKEEFNKELQQAVADTKKQQWCAECWKEAVYYCCWNTSYCSYQCQQKHWPSHMPKCMQTQTQGTLSSSTQSPTIISTLNATLGTNKSNMTMSTTSLPSNIIVVTTTPSTHPTTVLTSLTTSKTAYRVPTVSIVSPSQWKATEEASKAKKMYSLVSPQPTSAALSTLSIGSPHFQIQYLPQQATGALPQQVQVVGANPSSVPLLMSSMITSQNQNPLASPVHLLQNTSMLPLMQRPQQAGLQQQSLGTTRYLLPNTFGTFIRPGGPV